MALTIQGLSKTYGYSVRALKDVSLAIGNPMFGVAGAEGRGQVMASCGSWLRGESYRFVLCGFGVGGARRGMG